MNAADRPAASPDLAARQWIYRFLARGYSYPGPDFGRGLHQPELWDCLAAAGRPLGDHVGREIARLRACIGEECPLLDLQVEFTYLFVTANPHVPAPPYESAYSREGLLMGEAVSQVLQAYRNAGLAMRQTPGLLPDHVSTELEFVAYLAGQEAAARPEVPAGVETWRARQQRFLEEHLLCWGPAFVGRVTQHARRPFYAQLADLTAALLRAEEQRLRRSESAAGRKP